MPTARQRAAFLARVDAFAAYLALARDRCDDHRLAWKINAAIHPLDELLRPPSHVVAQTGIGSVRRYRAERRNKPMENQ